MVFDILRFLISSKANNLFKPPQCNHDLEAGRSFRWSCWWRRGHSFPAYSECSAGICKWKTVKEREEEKEGGQEKKKKMERERETQQTEVTLVKLEVWRKKTCSRLKAAFLDCCFKTHHVLLNSFCSKTGSDFYTLAANSGANIEKYSTGLWICLLNCVR